MLKNIVLKLLCVCKETQQAKTELSQTSVTVWKIIEQLSPN